MDRGEVRLPTHRFCLLKLHYTNTSLSITDEVDTRVAWAEVGTTVPAWVEVDTKVLVWASVTVRSLFYALTSFAARAAI